MGRVAQRSSTHSGAIVVSGAAGGIGEQIVRAALEAGAIVVASDIEDEALARLRDRLPPTDSLVLHRGDASSPSDILELESLVATLPAPLRLWVNCAGIVRRAEAGSFPSDAWDGVMAVNVRSTLLGAQAARRRFDDGGAIVNLSSIVTRKTMPGRAAYASSKAAIEQLTKQLALEWGPEGVRVNAVAPGFILTPISHLYGASREERSSVEGTIPLRRLGRPHDVAELVLFLGTDAASYLTGQTIAVDGGVSLG